MLNVPLSGRDPSRLSGRRAELVADVYSPTGRDRVKVVVDHDMCEGHGKCQQAAPGIFELRDDDLSYVLVDDVPEESQDLARQAVRLCPRQAIKIIEES